MNPTAVKWGLSLGALTLFALLADLNIPGWAIGITAGIYVLGFFGGMVAAIEAQHRP